MLRISNHTACRFAEKARFFRSLWAGRRCAAASRFTFFKAKTLYTESADEQADGRYAARISAGRLCAFTQHAAGECVSRCLRRACKAIPENVVVYFAGERKGGTRRFSEQTLCVSNYAACRSAEKARFFRSLWAGRRCAAASRFPLFQSGNALEQFNFEKAGRSEPM